MFSGITNQVSSWMGAAKGEPQDEEVPTPTSTKDAAATGGDQAADGEKQRYEYDMNSLFTILIFQLFHWAPGWLQTLCVDFFKLIESV